MTIPQTKKKLKLDFPNRKSKNP